MSHFSVQGNPFTDAEVAVLQSLAAGGTATPQWGNIIGTLSNQTDLQTALDAKVAKNANITASTRTKITYDVKGLVTAGTDANQDDIGDGATYKQYSVTDKTKVGYITITQAVDLDTIESRVNALDAAVVLKGAWDASAGTFPGGGTAQAGDSYIVSVAGTVNSIVFSVNDRILAILDNASTTTYANNWLKLDYTDQVLSVDGLTGAVSLSAIYQPLDSDLTAIAAIVPSNDDILQRKGGAWINRSVAQYKSDLALTTADLSNYTEATQDLVGALVAESDSILPYYDDAGNLLYIDVRVDNSTVRIDTVNNYIELKDGGITFAKLGAALVVTSAETIAANDNDTTIPTSAAVIDYVAANAGSGGFNTISSITYNSAGAVATIVDTTGGKTYTLTYSGDYLSTIGNGTNIWTLVWANDLLSSITKT